MSVSYSFCKHSNKVHPPSSPYITQKIRQIWFRCKGRRPRNKKTGGAAENQRNAWLCIAESRKPGFLDKNSSVHTPSGLPADRSGPPGGLRVLRRIRGRLASRFLSRRGYHVLAEFFLSWLPPGNWQKCFFQFQPWLAKIFDKNQKMRFSGMISKFNFWSPVWHHFSACFISTHTEI